MASIQGLPPLPKSLSGLLNFSGNYKPQQVESDYANVAPSSPSPVPIIETRNSPQRNGDHRPLFARPPRGPPPPPPNRPSSLSRASPPSPRLTPANLSVRRKSSSANLDSQLALLRKEMVGLRQLDMSLLCQLWSLNEAIQDFKQMITSGDLDSVSPNSQPGSTSWEMLPEAQGQDYYRYLRHGGYNSPRHMLDSVDERYSDADSTSSKSSLAYDDQDI